MIRHSFAATLVAAVMAAGATSIAQGRAFATWTPVPIQNGPNEIDIDGDGRMDLVFRAWRDNGNAHGYSLITVYRRGDDRSIPWEVVPFFDSKGETATSFRTDQGADCQLRGLALVRDPSSPRAPITAIIAQREFGQTYASAAKVTFTIYRVARNPEAIAGAPPAYLQVERTIDAAAPHCDVNEAFATELGIRVDP